MTAIIDHTAAALEGYVEVSKDEADTIKQLGVARRHESGWKKHKTDLTEKVKSLLDGAKGAVYEGEVLVTVKTRQGRRTVDLDRLASLHPDAYADCVSNAPEQVVLDLPK